MTHEEQLKKLKNIMAQFVGFTGIKLPDDVIAKLKELSEKETDPMPKVIYETMFRNQELAVKLNRIKPLDPAAINAVTGCARVFFFEEGVRSGGIGESFALSLLERGFKGVFRLVAVPDCFVPQASTADQLRQFGLDRDSIRETIR